MYISIEIIQSLILIIVLLLALRILLGLLGNSIYKKDRQKFDESVSAMRKDGIYDSDVETITVPEYEEKKKPFSSITSIIDATIVAIILVFFVIEPFILRVYRIDSLSMKPTLTSGYAVLASPLPIKFQTFKRGDIITFRPSEAAVELDRAMTRAEGKDVDEEQKYSTSYIKRLIGIPGDRIKIVRGDGIYVNGEFLEEDYVASPPTYNFPPRITDFYNSIYGQYGSNIVIRTYENEIVPYINDAGEFVVPKNKYFLVGDNRRNSLDSRIFGAIDKSLLDTKMLCVVWRPVKNEQK